MKFQHRDDAPSGIAGDDLLDLAIQVVLRNNFASVSLLQRHLLLSYSSALRVMGQMTEIGLVSEPPSQEGYRDVLWSLEKQSKRPANPSCSEVAD